MAKPKVKTAAAVGFVAQTRDDVAAGIAEIGRSQRALARIEAAMGDEIATVRARYETQAEPYKARIATFQAGVQIWCEANRMALTDGGKHKTAAFTTGEVRWRLAPPSVALKGIEAVLKKLREKGLTAFIRTKEEVNKEAILADPSAVKRIAGITINQAEEFAIVPHEAALDEVAA